MAENFDFDGNGIREGTMTGFCGWIGTKPTLSSPDETLAGMARALRTGNDDTESLLCSNGAIAASKAVMFGHGNLRAAITGSPYWPESSSFEGAEYRSTAKSLFESYVKESGGLSVQPGGTYSFAITDFDNSRAILATDRFGVQPLYYAEIGNGVLVFASDIASLLRHPRISRDLDAQSLFDFVYFHMIPSPATVYDNISKLEPGHSIIYDRGNITTTQHWRPEFVDEGSVDATYRTSLTSKLKGAVQRCSKISDKKVGAFLSGGLDSTTVSGMLSQIQEGPTHAYSIGFDQEGYDEMHFARIAARQFDLQLHEYYVTPSDVAAAIPMIASAYREPFGNSSAVPTFFCAKLAKDDGVDLLLAGDGGDELFAGNERYARQKIFAVYDRLPTFAKEKILRPIFAGDGRVGDLWPLRKIRSYIEQASVPMPRRMQTYNFVQRTPLEEIFEPEFTESLDVNHPYSELERVWNQNDSRSIVNRMLYLDWKFTLADNDLQKVNRMCEHAGMRVAYPMLDDELADFSLLIPPGEKLKYLKLRHFYKRSLRNFLPSEIINKSKHGFGLPFGHWLRESRDLQHIVYGSLEALKDRRIFRPIFIDTLLATHKSGDAGYYGEMIWVLTILEQWFEHHTD